MIHSLEELAQGLKSLGYPLSYSHFESAQTPPFICYIDDGENNSYGDNKVIDTSIAVRIELYTKTKDLDAEKKIKQFLNDNEIPYDKDPTIYIESEGLFLCVFNIEITE